MLAIAAIIEVPTHNSHDIYPCIATISVASREAFDCNRPITSQRTTARRIRQVYNCPKKLHRANQRLTMAALRGSSCDFLTWGQMLNGRLAALHPGGQEGLQTEITACPSTSQRGSTPKPGFSGAAMRPFLRWGAPVALLTVT